MYKHFQTDHFALVICMKQLETGCAPARFYLLIFTNFKDEVLLFPPSRKSIQNGMNSILKNLPYPNMHFWGFHRNRMVSFVRYNIENLFISAGRVWWWRWVESVQGSRCVFDADGLVLRGRYNTTCVALRHTEYTEPRLALPRRFYHGIWWVTDLGCLKYNRYRYPLLFQLLV